MKQRKQRKKETYGKRRNKDIKTKKKGEEKKLLRIKKSQMRK